MQLHAEHGESCEPCCSLIRPVFIGKLGCHLLNTLMNM